MVAPPGVNASLGAVVVSGLLEGVGIPWPGAVVLAAAGANDGNGMSSLLTGTWFAIVYTGGSLLQYLAGRYCRNLLGLALTRAQQSKLDRIIQRYGQMAVFWTRPLAVGNYVSIPAGLMKMNPVKFLLFTFLGIWPWAATMAFAGTYLAKEIFFVEQLLPYAAALLAVAGLWPVLHRIRSRMTRRNRNGSTNAPDSEESTQSA